MAYFLLLLGLAGLIKGADFFVLGSSRIATTFRIPPMIIGLTIVSIGTSLPEAAVSITAALSGSNDLALSNVTGSNIFNMLVVAGLCIVIRPITSDRSVLKRDFPVSLAASVLLLAFMLDGVLSRMEGLLFLAGFVGYLVFLVVDARRHRRETAGAEIVEPGGSLWKNVCAIVIGVAAIILGGDLVVDNAVWIAQHFGLSETFIGLTIVSIGTSLPELVTSAVAARRGESEIALGNALGSCVANILLILGSSALISPIAAGADATFYIWVMLFAVGIMYLFATTGRVASRKEGVVALLLYVLYMGYLLYHLI